ncbi:ABC-F family ATP-binding cassette domain-containing protein [Dysgonomonas macrotermitis]|uniref:ATPase components of ABC transporters with duplicated ATPase domains n=1 Tax=Dysgonomonas macrotermitis TaxID=1346286 RepID=A0A1M4X438_9BACT|nr:ABC-F family ATP-binding cassette domain-containing protein [Dysgonomonas macrotermitis]SHE87952.1 ATPase components of ABC transporters with duplicated ATPase domains [Dysgonomonas macrotermitis]
MTKIVDIQNFTYEHPDREVLFRNINLQIVEGQKIALIGRNGTGKTTLLRAITDYEKYPEIKTGAEPYNIPQHVDVYNSWTIARILGIEDKLCALNAISAGDTSQENFDILDDDWDIENKAISVLSYWDMEQISLNSKMEELSGGEKIKIFLSGITLHQPKFVILDEPTNHLDYAARETLYAWIKNTTATLLIVSHDRYLLNLLTDMYELTEKGINFYPGNYDAYEDQKEAEQDALLKQLDSQRQELKKAKKIQQAVVERRQKIESRGKGQTAKKSIPRIVANARKGAAEQTSSNLADKHSKKIAGIGQSIQQLKEGIDNTQNLRFSVADSQLHKGKILAEAIAINYSYNEDKIWETNLSFTITSGNRIQLKGRNGSGKSTLIKLITRQYQTTEGILKLADFDFLYLDQSYSLINDSKTVYEQAQQYNNDMPESEVKRFLTHSQFFSDTWDKPCSVLSGGEKMKLSLCFLVIANKAPDMLILDEPTNNLDISSMEVLIKAVKDYSGSLVVVSHDKYFTDQVGLENEIDLDVLL